MHWHIDKVLTVAVEKDYEIKTSLNYTEYWDKWVLAV